MSDDIVTTASMDQGWNRSRSLREAYKLCSFYDGPPESVAASVQSVFASRRGTWFDEDIDLREPEGERVTEEALALLAQTKNRTRRRRPSDDANHRLRVSKILANAYRCESHRRSSFVAYSRRAARFEGSAIWLSGREMGKTIDLLEGLGWVESHVGEFGGASSTFAATQSLCEVFHRHGVTEDSLTRRLPLHRLLRLRTGNSDTPLIEFPETDTTDRWRARLEAYNAFAARQDVLLAISDDEAALWIKRCNLNRRKSDVPISRPERFKTDLYRQFNNGSLEEGGRLYGGWWISVPKILRSRIEINGEPTIELDFSGCAIRMLYHEKGLDYLGDPYWLRPIVTYEKERGLSGGYYRDAIKAITQALINDQSGGSPEQISLPERVSFRPRFKRVQVRRMIEKHHSAIADSFGTGAGLRLQRKDSDIALSVITNLREQGILALPIHDSFIVPLSKKSDLLQQMVICYEEAFGLSPIVKWQ